MGNVFYDSSAHIQYRQHNSNLSGHKTTGLGLLRSRLYRPFKGNLGHDFEFFSNSTFYKYLLKILYQINIKLLEISQIIERILFLVFSFSSLLHIVQEILLKDLCIRYRILFNCL